ncbi:hypothetical protein EUX98_g6677 [Antrodiella citrinella]|uniref:Uncharacterized protein n=1 Tax=Antrodiella citrinella TaxID=2447956 RepID=A0A4V3XI17_9APHY|nr:hypothetical protein EUX98_g6677 [Antrodiella citrinella]
MSTKKRGPYIPYIERTSPDNSPTTAPTDIRSDSGSRWASPAPQPSTYSSWTPALAPIVGSPSIPAPVDFPIPDPVDDGDRGDQYAEDERDVGPPPPLVRGDVEQGMDGGRKEWVEGDQPRKTRGFMGGFISELKKIPAFMAKNNPRGSAIAADGAGPGPSPRLSYYSSASPSVHNSPLPSQPTQPRYRPSTVPIEELYDSEASDSASQVQPRYEDQQRDDENQQRYENYDGTTAAHEPMYDFPQDASITSSPLQVGATEMTDYEKTQTPYPFTNPEDKTLQSYIDRLHRAFTDFYYLPWVSLQVATEYIPAEDSSRGRYRKGPSVSWYAPKRRKEKPQVDLMASPVPSSHPPMIQTIPPTPTLSGVYSAFSQTTRSVVPSDGRLTLTASQYTYAPTHTQRSYSRAPSDSGMTAFREFRSPAVATTVSAYPSPGASSHGLGQHSISESYHYASPPRNVRPYPSVASALSSPPQTRLGPDYYTPKY